MNPAEAEKRILENIKTKVETLDLSRCELDGSESFWRLFEQCGHLRELNLASNKLTDMSFLQGLAGLESLCLFGNKITDISVLKAITDLHSLDLSYNQILDYSILQELPVLQILDLGGNQISNYSFLKKLHSLQTLALSRARISDISFLKELSGLQNLYLAYNQIVNIFVLQELSGLQTLALGNNLITDFSVLQGLTGLKELDLRNNQIADISFLQGLKDLNKLSLNENKIIDISVLQRLMGLQNLVLSENQISDISALQGLTGLQYLSLTSNQITDISVLQKLTDLNTLYLDGNQITDIVPLMTLQKLGALDLRHNPLTDLPKEILDLGLDVKWIMNFGAKNISLYGNPLPPAMITAIEENGRAGLQNYFKQLEEQERKYLFEAKILMLGEGGAGKTTFTKKIQDASAPLPNDSTHGIETHLWSFEADTRLCRQRPEGMGDKVDFVAHIWDLGGQEIYKGTHQFFFGEKILYVLLINTRNDIGKIPLRYWFETVEQQDKNGKVVVVVNQEAGHLLQVEGQLAAYRHLIKDEPIYINLSEANEIPRLQEKIKRYLMDLPGIGEPVPGYWPGIRGELTKIAVVDTENYKPYISFDKLQDICAEHRLTAPADVETMCAAFHGLGVFTHFGKDDLLSERVYLDSGWLCGILYKVLDDQEVKKAEGRIDRATFDKIWAEDLFVGKNHRETEKLLRLLLRFSLMYPVSGQGPYVVPAHLPQNMPYEIWAHEQSGETLSFVYEFDNYMPKGLIPRLMVSLYHHIHEHSQSWLYGFNILREGASAEIKEESLQTGGKTNRLWFRAAGGRPEAKTALLSILREVLEKSILEQGFPNMKYEKLVPCICEKCSDKPSVDKRLYSYDELVGCLNNGVFEERCKTSYKMVSVSALLGAVELDEVRKAKVLEENRETRREHEKRIFSEHKPAKHEAYMLTAYANDWTDRAGYLHNLSKESRGIRKALDGWIDEIPLNHCSVEDIFRQFEKKGEGIKIFHYAGHANGDNLFLETDGNGNLAARKDGLVSFLSRQKGLKLLFFNGCNTAGFAQALKEANIQAAVIATHHSINDLVAADFASYFYKSLANGTALKEAWHNTQDLLNTMPDSDNPSKFFREGFSDDEILRAQEEIRQTRALFFEDDPKEDKPMPWSIWIPNGFVWEDPAKMAATDGAGNREGMETARLKESIITLIESNINKAFDELDAVFGKSNGGYNDLSLEYIARPNNFDMFTFRSKLKRFVKMWI